MRLVLVGPPGAGKGTQAAVLSEALGIPHVSTGELFRANIDNRTPLGTEAKRYLDEGSLVPDEVTNEMVRQRLRESDAVGGFLLDGFPRTIGQADVLAGILKDQDEHELDAVLEFKIPEEEVVSRMLARGRADDTETVIRKRLDVYHDSTEPLLDYYRDKLVVIDALGTVQEISDRALSALRARQGG
ncbi:MULTISPECIES: adenylate kinase [Actinoalloteichus]|uniref:Adenylate kinase n=1 Tax=Actinoalloteichus fjordicus TaxID=1612552 RepID=A0AAC9L7P1_9PSEU|nr:MULTISPECIES: adenylate kinase [Actinoalloteichus]APU12703.1 Adenylate kinase [Actinoalloteichus fjordicus]APU18673.1 Adenylate kinase [Actinoalloteichus sp. GBA129-24]